MAKIHFLSKNFRLNQKRRGENGRGRIFLQKVSKMAQNPAISRQNLGLVRGGFYLGGGFIFNFGDVFSNCSSGTIVDH